MSTDDQRIAIAEACGWRQVKQSWPSKPYNRTGWVLDGVTQPMGIENPPDYLSDLNAMHEAEKTLNTEEEKRIYVDHLVCRMKPGEFTVMAPAPQRAEAFLRTLNRWTEQPPTP